MEGSTFRHSAVAELLNEHFVEARMHLEHFRRTGGAVDAQFTEFQEKFAKSPAMPTYSIIDPHSLTEIHWHQLMGTRGLDFVEEIQEFLEQAVGRHARRPDAADISGN